MIYPQILFKLVVLRQLMQQNYLDIWMVSKGICYWCWRQKSAHQNFWHIVHKWLLYKDKEVLGHGKTMGVGEMYFPWRPYHSNDPTFWESSITSWNMKDISC